MNPLLIIGAIGTWLWWMNKSAQDRTASILQGTSTQVAPAPAPTGLPLVPVSFGLTNPSGPTTWVSLWLGSDLNSSTWLLLNTNSPEEICTQLSGANGAFMRAGTSGQIVTDTFGNLLAASFLPGTMIQFCPTWEGP